MPGNGATFHPEIYAQQRGVPPDHLRLAIRPHARHPFVIRGEHEGRIGRFHDTATVRIFTPEAELWREDQLALDGTVTRLCPGRPDASADGGEPPEPC